MVKNSVLKKILSAFIVVCILIANIPVVSFAVDDSALWEYSISNGEVTITSHKDPMGDLVIPSTIEGFPVTSIGYRAFLSNNYISSITIPSSITNIGKQAFLNCTSLTKVIVDDKNTAYSSVDGVLFDKDKTTLIYYPLLKSSTSYSIPSSVKSVSDFAFMGCIFIKDISIPQTVTSIGFSAFYGCSNLTTITVNSNSNSFSSVNGILFNKDKTTLVCYPPKKSSKSYTIPSSVTTIEARAFSESYNLNGITIPKSVTTIGDSAFYECLYLKTVNYLGTKQDFSKITIGAYNEDLLSAKFTYHTCSFTKSNETAASCTESGKIIYSCTCGESYEETVAALGHDYSVFVKKIEPQVGFAGYTIYKCSRCDLCENRDFVAALPGYGGSEIPTDRVNNVKLTTTDVDMTLTWDAFKDATRYWIKYNKVGETKKETIKTTATSLTITYKTLDYNTEYEFMVYAQVGSKVQTKADMVSGKFTLKDRAVNHKVTYEGKAAILNFDVPEGITAKTRFVKVYNKETGENVTTVQVTSSETSARLINDLVPGIPYYAVVSLYVNGKYMAIDKCIPIDFTIPLSSIEEYEVDAETPTSVRISWASATSKIYYYWVAIYEKDTNTRLTTKQTKQTYTAFTGLKPNTEYEITIQASVQYTLPNKNVATVYYKGPNGDGVLPRVSYKTPDYSYVEPTVVADGNNVTVSWDAAEAATSYYIYKQTESGRKLVKSVGKSVTSYVFEAEAGKHTYGVAVCIKNYAGTSYAPVTWADAIVVK